MKMKAYYVVYQDAEYFEDLEYAAGPFPGRQPAEDWIYNNRGDTNIYELKNIYKIVATYVDVAEPLTFDPNQGMMDTTN